MCGLKTSPSSSKMKKKKKKWLSRNGEKSSMGKKSPCSEQREAMQRHTQIAHYHETRENDLHTTTHTQSDAQQHIRQDQKRRLEKQGGIFKLVHGL